MDPTKISAASLAQAQFLASFLNSHAAMQATAASRLDHADRRLDADETNMLALQLEQMRTKVYEVEYSEVKARRLFPTDTDIDPGAETFAYEETDDVASFVRLNDVGQSDDLPTAETSSTKVSNRIVSYGGSFITTIQELRRAAFAGRPLSARKPKACRRAWERRLEDTVANGDAPGGIAKGIANRALGTGASQTRNTAFTEANWTPGTVNAANMLAQLMELVKEFVVDADETITPTDLALPLASYMLASQTYFNDGTTDTVLARFARDNGFIPMARIHSWNALKASEHGQEATSRALIWKNDADAGSIVIAQDFEVFPPQIEGFATKTMAHGRTGGFVVYRPLAFRYGTGLPA